MDDVGDNMGEEEKVTLHVLAKEMDAQTIRNVIADVETELGVSSEANVKKAETKFIPGMEVILVAVGKEFVKAVVEKYGDSFKDWLARKLGLDESKGEEVRESE